MAPFTFTSSDKLIAIALLTTVTAVVRLRQKRYRRARALSEDRAYGYTRKEMNTIDLPGTLDLYSRHLFVVGGEALKWPHSVDKDNILIGSLTDGLKKNSAKITGKPRLTACEGVAAYGDKEGDILIFPEGIRVRGVTPDNAASFAVAFLTGEKKEQSSFEVTAVGISLFVCGHMVRDRRCGVIGPHLTGVLRKEVSSQSVKDSTVRMCSHIGGHKYAGNVLIFSRQSCEKEGVSGVIGDWYGYVTPEIAKELVTIHIKQGKVLPKFWRGRMGKTSEEQLEWIGSCKDCICSKYPVGQANVTQ